MSAGRPSKTGSPLNRQEWAATVLLAAQSESYFNPFMNTGTKNMNSLVYRNGSVTGDTVNFPAVGSLTGRFTKGDADLRGKGERKRTFSSKLYVSRYRKTATTDTAFDRHTAGLETELNFAGVQRDVTNLFRKWYDQAIIDCLQGVAGRTISEDGDGRATNVIRVPSSDGFDYNKLNEIERIVSEGDGFTFGPSRAALEPFDSKGMEGKWLFIIDSYTLQVLKNSAGFQRVIQQADTRGMDNRLISRTIGDIGALRIMTMPRYRGEVSDNDDPIAPNAFDANGAQNSSGLSSIGREDFELEVCGLRQYDANNRWTGQPSFSKSGDLWSRNLLVAPNAVQVGISSLPFMIEDRSSTINGISEVGIETWMGFQKTKFDPETRGDYKDAKFTNLDLGVIAVDVQVK